MSHAQPSGTSPRVSSVIFDAGDWFKELGRVLTGHSRPDVVDGGLDGHDSSRHPSIEVPRVSLLTDRQHIVVGILYKFVNLGSGWKARLFVLHDGVLKYYKVSGPHATNLPRLFDCLRRKGELYIVGAGAGILERQAAREVCRGASSAKSARPGGGEAAAGGAAPGEGPGVAPAGGAAGADVLPTPAGEIHLAVAAARGSSGDSRKLYLSTGTDTLALRAESPDDRWVWVEAIRAARGEWDTLHRVQADVAGAVAVRPGAKGAAPGTPAPALSPDPALSPEDGRPPVATFPPPASRSSQRRSSGTAEESPLRAASAKTLELAAEQTDDRFLAEAERLGAPGDALDLLRSELAVRRQAARAVMLQNAVLVRRVRELEDVKRTLETALVVEGGDEGNDDRAGRSRATSVGRTTGAATPSGAATPGAGARGGGAPLPDVGDGSGRGGGRRVDAAAAGAVGGAAASGRSPAAASAPSSGPNASDPRACPAGGAGGVPPGPVRTSAPVSRPSRLPPGARDDEDEESLAALPGLDDASESSTESGDAESDVYYDADAASLTSGLSTRDPSFDLEDPMVPVDVTDLAAAAVARARDAQPGAQGASARSRSHRRRPSEQWLPTPQESSAPQAGTTEAAPAALAPSAIVPAPDASLDGATASGPGTSEGPASAASGEGDGEEGTEADGGSPVSTSPARRAGEPEWLREAAERPPHRTHLPRPATAEKSVSLWSLIKGMVGKDLSRVCLPVYFNEPLSALQKAAEELEYSRLLDIGAAQPKGSAERLLCVSALAVSGYACTVGRTSKPFNPLLAETYELLAPERGIRFLSEKVVHHPTIIASTAEGARWRYDACSKLSSKFWGRSIEIRPEGANVVTFDDGDVYCWNKVVSSINNLVLGKIYIDHSGIMVVKNLTTSTAPDGSPLLDRAGRPTRSGGPTALLARLRFKGTSTFSDRDPHQVKGSVERGETRFETPSLRGHWDRGLDADLAPGMVIEELSFATSEGAGAPHGHDHGRAHHHRHRARRREETATAGAAGSGAAGRSVHIWTPAPPPPDPTRYNLTAFAISLNEMTADEEAHAAPTDCRRRPDQAALERGEYDLADREKQRLEVKQRAARAAADAGEPIRPRWFRQTDGGEGVPDFVYAGGYWESRKRGKFEGCRDIFGA